MGEQKKTQIGYPWYQLVLSSQSGPSEAMGIRLPAAPPLPASALRRSARAFPLGARGAADPGGEVPIRGGDGSHATRPRLRDVSNNQKTSSLKKGSAGIIYFFGEMLEGRVFVKGEECLPVVQFLYRSLFLVTSDT